MNGLAQSNYPPVWNRHLWYWPVKTAIETALGPNLGKLSTPVLLYKGAKESKLFLVAIICQALASMDSKLLSINILFLKIPGFSLLIHTPWQSGEQPAEVTLLGWNKAKCSKKQPMTTPNLQPRVRAADLLKCQPWRGGISTTGMHWSKDAECHCSCKFNMAIIGYFSTSCFQAILMSYELLLLSFVLMASVQSYVRVDAP